MTSVQLIIGLVLLLGGGEAMVKGSIAVAKRLGVSPLLIGLTLVGFGTSTPELVASLQAALIGAPGIAIGNIVGSTIANILLVLGLSAVLVQATEPWRPGRHSPLQHPGLVVLADQRATVRTGVLRLARPEAIEIRQGFVRGFLRRSVHWWSSSRSDVAGLRTFPTGQAPWIT